MSSIRKSAKLTRCSHIFLMWLLIAFSANAQDSTFISLKPVEFREEITMVNNPVIVDVREFFEYKRSRIEGSVNVPVSDIAAEFADTMSRFSHIFLYCTTDFRSKRAARSLAERGFMRLYSLEGGIAAWKKEGLPVDRSRIRKRKS